MLVVVHGQNHLIDGAVGLVLVHEGRGLERVVAQFLGVVHLRRHVLGNHFVDEDLPLLDFASDPSNAVAVKVGALEVLPIRATRLGEDNAVLGHVGVLLERGHLLLEHDRPPEPPVHRRPVENHRILDIVAGVRHDGDGRVLPRGQPVEVDQLDRLRLGQGALGVDEEVEEGVDALQLVVCDRSDRLLAHRALVGVTWRLVVVRVGDQPCARAHHREGVDFEVGGVAAHARLVERNHAVVLLVHVEVLDEPLLEEIRERAAVVQHLLDVVRRDEREAVENDDEGAAYPPAVARNVHRLVLEVGVDRNKLSKSSRTPHCPHQRHKSGRVAVDAEDKAVEEHQVQQPPMRHLFAGEHGDVLYSKRETEALDRSLLVVGGDVCHQRKVLDQAARLPLGGVGRAEHTPLGGLQRARP
mmetsp:Transcript_55787/g.132415  ORF Transcript_55787/g.132415 Transcript_55787/m.132415 type:complete len:413 (-) Transcript_55787:1471-2709(-)